MTRAGRVNLLLASGADAIGTAERVIWELATRLPATRYDVRVWLSPSSALDEMVASLAERGIETERTPQVRSRWDMRGQAVLWATMRRVRPSLIHLHGGGQDLPRALPPGARMAGGAPVIASVQGSVTEPSAELAALLRGADAVTAVCTPVAETLRQLLALSREAIRVVPNGAEPGDEIEELPAARQMRERLHVGPFRPLWVTATRLEPEKGHEVLLEALVRVRERHMQFVVVVAGEGSQRAALERRTADLGLDDAVHFLGRVDSLGPVLRAADAFVLPSRAETLPLTLLEAMVRGCPVVATEVGGIADVVETGVHGHLIPPDDPEALAAALENLHQMSDRARRMGQRAEERVRSGWTWESVIEAYEVIYDELLGLAGFAPEDAAGTTEADPGAP